MISMTATCYKCSSHGFEGINDDFGRPMCPECSIKYMDDAMGRIKEQHALIHQFYNVLIFATVIGMGIFLLVLFI